MPSLSIITINLNNAAGLRKTIKSVISQSCINFEYIVIDGGSTDGSTEVIKEFADHFAYWISEPDHGIYQAMNKGIRWATGDYCQFLNSGDILVSSTVTERMLKNANPATNIIIGNMLKAYAESNYFRDKGIGARQPTLYDFFRGSINHSPAYIPRRLFQKYGMYDESLRIVADWKWYLQAIVFGDEQVAYRNIDVTMFDMSGVSNTHNELMANERGEVLKELLAPGILADYQNYWPLIDAGKRIRKYPLLIKLNYLIDRFLFQFEKHSL